MPLGCPSHPGVSPLVYFVSSIYAAQMALVTYADTTDAIGADAVAALQAARERTRKLPYGEITGAVFPIAVGPDTEDKAWYQVISQRPLRLSWLPFTSYQVAPEALSEMTRRSIYRLIEADINST